LEAMKLTYSSSLTDIRELNSSFDVGTLQICYPGSNRNKTYISKHALEKAIPSMFNCPVVCNYHRSDGALGSHDMEVITDYDDSLRVVNITQPVGVIPESARVFFKEVTEEDGVTHEYLCADVYLWKRQEAYKVIKEKGITGQSMEINVLENDYADGVCIIDKLEFTAFCLLDDSVEPCFESASLQMYALNGDEFREQYKEMLSEFKEAFTLATTPESGVDHITTEISEEGGSCQMVDETKEVFNDTEEVKDEVEEVVVEETPETFAEEEAPEVEEENFALNSNFREAMNAAFAGQTIPTEWGEMERYCVCDYDVEAKLIYAWDMTDWLLYGFAYDMDGDNVVVDFESRKRMKYIIAEFDEGETQDSPFAFAYEQMSESMKVAKENVSDLESKYQTASEQIDSMNTELEELRKFKSDVEDASDKAQRDELFAQFADLNDVAEFAALVADSSEYDIETLEEKCFAIRGRNMKLNFSKNEVKAPKLPVVPDADKDDDEPYGGAVKKYLKK